MELKILLVDDDELILQSLKARCERARFKVLTATSGREAISLIGEHRDINVICSDLKMPNGGGDSILEYLRDTEERIPVMIVTTNDMIYKAELNTGVKCLKLYLKTAAIFL